MMMRKTQRDSVAAVVKAVLPTIPAGAPPPPRIPISSQPPPPPKIGPIFGGADAGLSTPRRQWRHFIGQLVQMDEGPPEESGMAHKIRLALPHVLIFSSTILYGLLGAMVFHRLERPFELAHLQKHALAISQAQNALVQLGLDHFSPNESLDVHSNASFSFNATLNLAIDELIRVTMEAFEEGIREDELVPFRFRPANLTSLEPSGSGPAQHRPKWNFHSSLFFTATLLTSIGYGNLVPISPLGRLFCILYAFLGIPLTLMSIADVAKFFGDLIMAGGDWLEEQFGRKGQVEEAAEGKRMNAENGRRRSGGTRGSTRMARDQGEQLLRSAGPYTKAFVLSLLLLYMMTMAVLFSRLQPGWGLLGSLYFTLITLVTIGFGDYCPPANTGEHHSDDDDGDGHYGFWILFIFVGLTLSTLTVDMVGSSYIDRIHNLGRGFHLGSFFTMLKLGRGDCPDSARLLAQLHAGSYIPADLKLIPYIDALIRSRSSAETLVNGEEEEETEKGRW